MPKVRRHTCGYRRLRLARRLPDVGSIGGDSCRKYQPNALRFPSPSSVGMCALSSPTHASALPHCRHYICSSGGSLCLASLSLDARQYACLSAACSLRCCGVPSAKNPGTLSLKVFFCRALIVLLGLNGPLLVVWACCLLAIVSLSWASHVGSLVPLTYTPALMPKWSPMLLVVL